MKRKLRLTTLLLLVLLLAAPTLAVLAKEISSVSVEGPGIDGEITLTGGDDMYSLMDAGFIDTMGFMSAPAQKLGTPYTITVHLDLDGKVLPFVRMEYYPMEAGRAGYVHTTGRLDGESLRDVDQWSIMPQAADDLFRKLMSEQGVELQTAVFAAAPAASAPQAEAPAVHAPAATVTSRAIEPVYLAVGLLAAAALISVTGLLVRKSRRVMSG